MSFSVQTKIKRTSPLFFLILLVAVFSGCGVYKPFSLMDDNIRMKAGTLAVIAGFPDEANAKLADSLTLELKQRSTFRVLSQDEVARRLGKYPQTIKTAQPKDENKPVWFAAAERSKLDAMQGQLKTDYLLVVWVTDLARYTYTSSGGGSRVVYSAGIIGNSLEYPKGRVTAYTNFSNDKNQTCCLFGKSEGEDIDELLKDSAERIAEKFIDATGSKKPAK